MLSRVEYAMPAHMLEAYRIERKTVWNAVDYRHILVLMVKGTCEFLVDGKRYAAEAGDAVFLPAGIQYTRRPLEDRPAAFYYLHFEMAAPPREEIASALLAEARNWNGDPLEESPVAVPPALILPTLTHIGDKIEETARKLLDALYDGRTHVRMLADMYLHALLMHITSCALERLLANDKNAAQERIPLKLRSAIAYIHRNYTSQIRLSDMCAACGVSPQHLIRLFKAETGMTPVQYINNYRVSRAQMMIRDNPNLSVKEISYELGFENPHYFSRLFTKILGQTPRSMRSRVAQMESDDRS